MRQRVVIIGGGLAGLSTAYHLAKAGAKDVVVIEREKRLGAHASGNNAGMIRQTVSDPVLAGLAAKGQKTLSSLKGSHWKDLDFRANGSLLLSDENESELDRVLRTCRKVGISCRQIKKGRASKKVSALQNAQFDRALFCPTDAIVNVGGLLEGLQKELKRLGVRVLVGHPLQSIHRSGGGFILSAGAREFTAKKVINAAGAWAGEVARIAGASRLPLKPYLRHLYECRDRSVERKCWPFVWHLDRGLYFRPIPQGILISPCDKSFVRLGKPLQRQAARLVDSKAKASLTKKLKNFNPTFNLGKLGSQKAGLRTMAPDGRFVIGEDPKLMNFYWVAGLGGHGVTASFSIGDLAARLVLGKKTNTQTATWASPARFGKK